MRHFYRTHLTPAAVIQAADAFFPTLELAQSATGTRARTFGGPLGTLMLSAKYDGDEGVRKAATDHLGRMARVPADRLVR